MRQGLPETEEWIAQRLRAAGWAGYRGGWPDFLAVKGRAFARLRRDAADDLTLRDLFAAAALAGSPDWTPGEINGALERARFALDSWRVSRERQDV